jgi:hypothetical protein
MRIKVEIEGTEVTVDTQAPGTQQKPAVEQATSGDALPPELAAAVAAGDATDGGRAPDFPPGNSPPGAAMESSAAEDRSGGAAPADGTDPSMMRQGS